MRAAEPYSRYAPRGATAEERLALYSDRSGGVDACWPWLGALGTDGYGNLWVDKRSVGAHRLAYQVANGPIPPGMQVCHRCDVPSCVNPAHLWLGSNRDNCLDREAKGRGRWRKHPQPTGA